MTDKVLLQLTEALSKGKNGELYTIIDGDEAGSKAFFARDVADQVIFMDRGVIVEQGEARQVIERPARERTRQFLARYAQQ